MRGIRILTMTLAALIAAAACTAVEIMPEEKMNVVEGEVGLVTVTLDLNLADEIDGTPGTKAVDDPVDEADTQIRNLCVLQYAGTDADAPLVGDVHYFSKDFASTDENYLSSTLNNIKLVSSQGAQHTLVILANTFTKITPPGDGKVKTLGDMLSAYRAAEGESAVLGHVGSGTGVPNDVTYYQRLSAIAVTVISDPTTVHAILRRSMSRISVEIVNTGADNLQIQSVQLRNVSQKDYYLTDYSFINSWTGWGETEYSTANLISDTFHDEFFGPVPMRMDYRARTWAEGNPVTLSGGSVKTKYTWYVPCNMRGTDPIHNTDPDKKGNCINAIGATYLYVAATYGSDNKPVEYRFYLGKNLYDNFDLNPGTAYNYTFTFNGKGRPATDGRVEAWVEDFAVDANCYMVTPPPAGTAIYSFNVVHRINTFWGSPLNSDRYGFYNGGEGTYASNFIQSSGEPWYARIIWSNRPYDRDAILIKKTGDGSGSYMSDSQRVQIAIPAGTLPGSIVIGVYTGSDPESTENTMLWSWHIWITDYRPDDAQKLSPIAGKYVYKVTGGEVHRYGGTMWASGGRYANAFIMDRNLGATRDWWSKNGSPCVFDGFFYQFGRKDMFLPTYYGNQAHSSFYSTIIGYTYAYGSEDKVKYNGSNVTVNSETHRATVGAYSNAIDEGNTGQSHKNVPYSIMYPTRFITGNTKWTTDDIFYTAEWHDPKKSMRDDPNYEEGDNGDTQNKSIFDPCPPGWRVPANGWASGMNAANCLWNVEETYGRGRGLGRTYFPEYVDNYDDIIANPDRQSIFFPALSNYSGRYTLMEGWTGTKGRYWSSGTYHHWSMPYGRGYCFNFNNTTDVSPETISDKVAACSVRCIHE